MIRQLFSFTLLACLLSITACKKDAVHQAKLDYKKYSQYITRYPQGPISRCSNIVINLGFEVDRQQLPPNIIEIDPPLNGYAKLSDNKRSIILEHPSIKHNVEYTVKFHIGQLTEMPTGMETFTFPIEAIKQSLDIVMDAPINLSMEQVSYSGKVTYTDCEPVPFLIEACLAAEQKGAQLNVTWNHDSSKRASSFVIQGIKRDKDPSVVNVTLDMGPLNVDDVSELQLAVPSQSDFSFHGIKQDRGTREVELIFTDPISTTQDLSGLVNIPGRNIQHIKVNNNIVNVFFKDESYGYFDLEILPGIQNIAGHPLKDTYEKELFFRPPLPQVSIAEKGNILPPDNQWELPVRLVTANGFRLRVLKVYDQNVNRLYQENREVYESQQGLENIGRLALDTTFAFEKEQLFAESYHSVALDQLVKRESGALYKIILTIPRDHIAYPCQTIDGDASLDRIDRIDFDKPWVRIRYGYDYYDEGNYNYYGNRLGRTYYNEYENTGGNPCQGRYADKIHDERLLMCTDVGVVAKWQPEVNQYYFYTSKITDATPVTGAEITLYNFQGREVHRGYSDGNGGTTITVGDELPHFMKASYGNDVTYLQLQDAQALSLSTFQVDGKRWNDGRKVYFYGDREVWRPGDTIYLNAMVYHPKKPIPASLPVNLKLYDPSNRLVKNWVEQSNVDGIYQCHFATDLSDATGKWRIELSLGGQVYRHPVRVETVRPNRLKMSMEFAKEQVLKHDSKLEAPVTVKWMHGMPAKELKTEVNMYQKHLKNPFGSNYHQYVFDDIRVNYESDKGIVKTSNTNDEGLLDFSIPTDERRLYPSMMLFNFELRAFEKGGAFSSDMKSIKYSPYTHYVGAKFPGGDNGSAIYVKDDQAIMLQSLNADGQVESRKVQVTLTKVAYNWWYEFGARGNYAALSNSLQSDVSSYEVTVGKSGKSISVDEYGRYLLSVRDIESGHSFSRLIYSYGDRWNDDAEEVSQLEVLPFHIENEEYTVGDNLSFDLPPMGDGRYLVTVESGGSIIHKEVRQTSRSPVKVNIGVNADMAPTAYVHVHLIQAWDTHLNDRPLRLFGIKPIKVYDPQTILHPEMTIPTEVKTDETFTVSVEEQEGKPMSYTVAIVDEGLLDITQFKTPDPWSAFFSKEGLQVKTWDMYRHIFHRFLGEYTSLLAVGGDGSNAINATSKARRFKPVVKYLGPFTLSAGEEKNHEIAIADYVGSVRVMIVATNGQAVGHSDETVTVKKPLMHYTTLPRVLGPEESIKVPVTVFVMDKAIKNVSAKIITDDLVSVVGSDTQQLTFDSEGEQDIVFDIETAESVGVAEVTVEVKAGDHFFTETIELDLRPSAPLITQMANYVVKPNATKTLDYNTIGMPGTRSAEVTVSKGLNFSFAPQVDWLSRYPHGCLEQTISSVFPQIYLYQMNLLDDVDQMKYRQHVAAVIQKLRFLQLPQGGFAYWSGGKAPSDWGTTYAVLFLLEAKEAGYNIPDDLLDRSVSYLYKSANSPVIQQRTGARNSGDRKTIAQAYKLYALSKAGKPNYAAMNRLRLVPQIHNTAKWLLAHAFMTIGEDDLSDLMIKSASQSTEEYRELSGTFGSTMRDQAIIARVLLDKGQKLEAKQLIDEMVNQLNKDNRYYFSTQERAQALITFAHFVDDLGTVEDSLVYDLRVSDDLVLEDVGLGIKPNIYQIHEEEMGESVQLKNESTNDIYASVAATGQPLRDESKKSSSSLEMEVVYRNNEGEEINPKTIKMGEDFKISYTVVHPGVKVDYENLALTAIFPSGWEILNQRMKTNTTFDQGSEVDYKDIRDDRVNLYFDLKKGGKKTFHFKCNATYEGKYWAPPAICEAMYDASIQAKDQGFWTTVER